MKTVSYHLTAVSAKEVQLSMKKYVEFFFFSEPNKVSVIERCPYKGSNRKEGAPLCSNYLHLVFFVEAWKKAKFAP